MHYLKYEQVLFSVRENIYGLAVTNVTDFFYIHSPSLYIGYKALQTFKTIQT
jgi:hypothetical protein